MSNRITEFVILNINDVGKRKVNLNKLCKILISNREKKSSEVKTHNKAKWPHTRTAERSDWDAE